jgi:hypothetical protein
VDFDQTKRGFSRRTHPSFFCFMPISHSHQPPANSCPHLSAFTFTVDNWNGVFVQVRITYLLLLVCLLFLIMLQLWARPKFAASCYDQRLILEEGAVRIYSVISYLSNSGICSVRRGSEYLSFTIKNNIHRSSLSKMSLPRFPSKNLQSSPS